MMMCDDLPTIDERLGGWHPCTPMLGLWVLHQKQAREMDVELQGPGHHTRRRSRFYRDNTGALRVAAGKITPEPLQMRTTQDLAKRHYREN